MTHDGFITIIVGDHIDFCARQIPLCIHQIHAVKAAARLQPLDMAFDTTRLNLKTSLSGIVRFQNDPIVIKQISHFLLDGGADLLSLYLQLSNFSFANLNLGSDPKTNPPRGSA
jgi:hypothetical protein